MRAPAGPSLTRFAFRWYPAGSSTIAWAELTRTRRGRGTLAAVLSALLLTACGSGEGTGPVIQTPPPTPPPPTPPPPPPSPRAMFTSPIAGVAMRDVFYGAYLDHGNRDFSCGFKWYAGHRGVDILLRNFRVQDSGVAVIAAAPGTVILTRDGIPDRSTVNGSGGFGNHVLVEHQPGGAFAYYGHLRNGSIRVTANTPVNRGDTLGLVGSSGNSNWPHLHFEVSDQGNVVDPFIGFCNPVTSPPTWENQLPWQGDFAVLDAGITRAPVSFASLLERPADVAAVTATDNQVAFWANLYNIQAGATRTVLLRADGTVLGQVTTGTFTTFSTRFLVATFSLSGLPMPAGQYAIAMYVTQGGVAEREVARRAFTFDPGVTASPQRAPGRGPAASHSVWTSPDAGDRP